MALKNFEKKSISYSDILQLNYQLNSLHSAFSSKGYKLPTKASYALIRNLKFLEPAVKEFSSVRDEIIKEHVEMGKDGRPKSEEFVKNQDLIDAITLSNSTLKDGETPGIVPEPVKDTRLVFKDKKNGEKEANDKITMLSSEKFEVSLYAFPEDLATWEDSDIPHNTLALLWDTVDSVEQLLSAPDTAVATPVAVPDESEVAS
jgi:hypothetical protein